MVNVNPAEKCLFWLAHHSRSSRWFTMVSRGAGEELIMKSKSLPRGLSGWAFIRRYLIHIMRGKYDY